VEKRDVNQEKNRKQPIISFSSALDMGRMPRGRPNFPRNALLQLCHKGLQGTLVIAPQASCLACTCYQPLCSKPVAGFILPQGVPREEEAFFGRLAFFR